MDSCKCTRPRARTGFTLIELLVVISIIGILTGLMLSGMSKVLEAVRMRACSHNLSEIGKAFEIHHTQLNCYPSGGWDWYYLPTYTSSGDPIVAQYGNSDQHAGWAFQILPYLDQEMAWRGAGGTSDGERARIAIGTPVKHYFCPSRRQPQTVTYPDEYLPPLPKLPNDPSPFARGMVTHGLCDYAASNLDGTGIVRQYWPVRKSDIAKECSTRFLLMVGEKRLNLTVLGRPFPGDTPIMDWRVPDDNEGFTAGFDEDTVRSTALGPAPDYYGQSPRLTGGERFGSSHYGRFNALFADGSVRSISYQVDETVFSYMGSITNTETIEDDDL